MWGYPSYNIYIYIYICLSIEVDMLTSFAYIADKHTPGMALDGGVPIQSPTLKGHVSRIRTVLNCLNATRLNIFVGNDVG